MKNNENKIQIKEYQGKLSPSIQRKKYYYSKNVFQNFETNNILLSPKKSQEELILPKKKVIQTTSRHRRTKSNNQNYIPNMTTKHINLNGSVSKISFIFGKKELENNYNYSSVSRNKNAQLNWNDNKKTSNNLLSISFSLKDFRNNIISAFSNNNHKYESKKTTKYNNIINLKNNQSLMNYDNITNIETRNTTSITNFNNSNLLYNKHLNNKEKQNSKSTKYIKIDHREPRQLYSSKNISSKIITFTRAKEKKEKVTPKYSSQKEIIFNNNNLNNTNNLILENNSLKNYKKFFSKEKLSNICPISELNNDENFQINKKKRILIKNEATPMDKNNNDKKIKKDGSPKYKKRKANSQENNYKKSINSNNNIGEFKSVEEIHFIFVYITQKKKEYFSKNNIEKKNKDKENL